MIRFVKAHSCGNDFLIVDAAAVPNTEKREAAIWLCSRNTGVGADGVEYLEWTGERSGSIQLFNADGSVAEISGNGTRCVAAWMAHEKAAAAGDSFLIQTEAGPRQCRIVAASSKRFAITTGMGVPSVSETNVTLADGTVVAGAVVSMGNPHFVIFVESGNFVMVGRGWEAIGREICFHAGFPHQTNVEFVRIVDHARIEIRIFERGVGPTTSSGTGTCASATAAIALRGLDADLQVTAPGGEQRVHWAGAQTEMTLTGPAVLIATGEAF